MSFSDSLVQFIGFVIVMLILNEYFLSQLPTEALSIIREKWSAKLDQGQIYFYLRFFSLSQLICIFLKFQKS